MNYYITVIGVLASIGSAGALLPQLIKVIKEKDADGTSAIMLTVLISENALWVVYGIFMQDWILSISCFVAVIINGLISILKFRYSKL